MSTIDYLVIGAGPGGLQLGYYLHRAGYDYLILERADSVGSFFDRFPRHRQLLSINKTITGIDDPETNLRWDWNSLLMEEDDGLRFTEYSDDYFPDADSFVEYLHDFAEAAQLDIEFNTEVVRVSKSDLFHVECESGAQYRAKRLIVATGRPEPCVPDIEGVEHCEWYTDYDIDPDGFTNQRVMVVGKGNSGLEAADSLINSASVIHLISPNPLRLAWRTHYVGDLRATNNNFLDTYQLKSQNTILDAEIDSIERLDDGRLHVRFTYTHASGQEADVLVDRVILCTGFKLDLSIFDPGTCMPAVAHDGKLPAVTSEWESTSVEDLYFAGALMHAPDYRKSFSGFIHGFRYNIKTLFQLFERKYESRPLPFEEYERRPESIVRVIIDRVCRTSSLFQMPAFLGDVLVMDDGRAIRYYKDLPVEYVKNSERFNRTPRMTLTMEYGHLADHIDPFNIRRYPTDGSRSVFIHPVIRCYDANGLVDEYHIPEDIENEWDQELYTAPFLDFLHGIMTDEAEAGEKVHSQVAGSAGR